MTELMDPTLAARALSAATEITSTALSGDDPGAVLDTVVARAAELADADLGLAMVSAEDGRVMVEAAHYATAHPAARESVPPEGRPAGAGAAGPNAGGSAAAASGTDDPAGSPASGTQTGEGSATAHPATPGAEAATPLGERSAGPAGRRVRR